MKMLDLCHIFFPNFCQKTLLNILGPCILSCTSGPAYPRCEHGGRQEDEKVPGVY